MAQYQHRFGAVEPNRAANFRKEAGKGGFIIDIFRAGKGTNCVLHAPTLINAD
jgi:hypothetical protein